MRILALILARGGSKRLPGKNILPLGGKPLIAWSIEAAKGIPDICDVLVSTDDEKIAHVAEKYGAMVPWLRPDYLATDTATSVDAALHAVDWYESVNQPVNGILLLQPTSPFRTSRTIAKGINIFSLNPTVPVIGVSATHLNPLWMLKIDDDGSLTPFINGHGMNKRSQDLPVAYIVNGSVYLISPEVLRFQKSFISEKCRPLIIESEKEALDIDNEWDYNFAKYLYELIGSES
ncbi:NTP transferase domain-containing protein [Chlorobium sp. KB01]|uniref:acylneuraminate cytidylyltransferase family protein n=1 Tax=Chlorobium sp. KB01 TaxID=1917528 RepID=UPI0009778F5A|nr:acylneuraminate cytidylyltransferase family protein [Chlorobium sp. KB01]